MKRNDILILIIGIAIALLIGGLYIALLATNYNQSKKLITNGLEDEQIKKEYIKTHSKKAKVLNGLSLTLNVLLSILFIGIYVFSMTCEAGGNCCTFSDNVTLKVVQSGSMSYKREENKYLFENDLNNQIDTFDMIFISKLPGEFELKQYDIVMYEVDEILVIHRIINIEEPNENHPNERWFQLKGDANISADRFPVKYEQMKGIYTGDKIPFVGAFILFLQSSLGYVAIAIILVYFVAAPIAEKKLDKLMKNRLIAIGYLNNGNVILDNEIEEKAPTSPPVEDKPIEEIEPTIDVNTSKEVKKVNKTKVIKVLKIRKTPERIKIRKTPEDK